MSNPNGSIRLPGLAPLFVLASVAVMGVLVLLPLYTVFHDAFSKGVGAYLAAIREPDALAAIRLTLTVAAISVPLNAVFGVAAAWAVTKFEFRGKSFLLTLIDLLMVLPSFLIIAILSPRSGPPEPSSSRGARRRRPQTNSARRDQDERRPSGRRGGGRDSACNRHRPR